MSEGRPAERGFHPSSRGGYPPQAPRAGEHHRLPAAASTCAPDLSLPGQDQAERGKATSGLSVSTITLANRLIPAGSVIRWL